MKGALLIHESSGPNGTLAPTLLFVRDRALWLSDAGTEMPVPEGALEAVLARYGSPVDPSASVALVGRLELGDGRAVAVVRHLARFDVIAKDYVVYESEKGAACALAVTVSAAICHLARKASA